MRFQTTFHLLVFVSLAAIADAAGAGRDFLAEADKLAGQPAAEVPGRELDGLLAEWAKEDPVAASEWVVRKLPEGEARYGALRGILSAWAENDNSAALEWAQKLPAGNTHDRAVASAVYGWARKDPAAAGEWLLKQPKDNSVEYGIPRIVSAWIEKDPPAAFAWTGKLQGQARKNMMFDTGSYWASGDLEGATARILQKDIEAYQRDRIIVEAAHDWARKDSAAVTAWALKLPEGKTRDYALTGIASVMAAKDPAAAADWAMKLPDGAVRKAAMEMADRQKKYLGQPKSIDEKLYSIIIGNLELNDAAVQDAMARLADAAKGADPEKNGVEIELKLAPSDQSVPNITASLQSVTLGTAIRFICRKAGLKCSVGKDKVVVEGGGDAKDAQGAAPPSLTADPGTGVITIDTERYTARIDRGILTSLHNKLTKTDLIGEGTAETSPNLPFAALIVQEAPLSGPVFRRPVLDGPEKSALSVKRPGAHRIEVTYAGLAGDGKDKKFFAADRLSIIVSVDASSGELLVEIEGASADTPVAGTSFAFSGLMRRYVCYSPNDGGYASHGDTEGDKWSPLPGVREWANRNMAKRTGSLAGGIWCAPVSVFAAEDNPMSAFSIWCEDDELLPKYYVGGKKSVSYVSLEYPPFDKFRSSRSVTWHVNTYSGGWTEAAKPYADSLAKRGFTKRRAAWAKEVSVIVQLPDLHPMWWKPLMELIPLEDRNHVLLYANGWRNQDFDRNHWDYTPSPGFIEGARGAREAGFRTLVYLQPMLCWGDASFIRDPNFREDVKKMQAQYCLDPFGRHKVDYTGLNNAYTPWRELMLGAARNAVLNYDVQGTYLDSTFIFLPDGRGRIGGMTSYEGIHRYIEELRRLSQDIFMGTEYPNELMAWGTDFGLHTGLEWAQGYEKSKARNSHPIYNYLFRDVMVTMNHANFPARKHYHLMEEIAERTGQVAAMCYDDVAMLKLDNPDRRLWTEKARLFARRGLRPYYPDTWEPGVMSYLKAEDGTVFAYEETDYGSKLVERAKDKPLVHYARVWGRSSFKTGDCEMLDWIGQADDGTWIGLVPDNGYVLMPRQDTKPAFRITQLPEGVQIKSHSIKQKGVAFQLMKEKTKDASAPTPDALGKTVNVTIRFRSPEKPTDIKTESSRRDAKKLLSDKKDDVGLDADMLSDTLLGLKEIPGAQNPDGPEYEAAVPLNEEVEVVY